MSLCQAGYGCLLSSSSWGWQLNPGGTLPTFPLQHWHRAWLPCMRPSCTAPCPHHSPGTHPQMPCQGTWRAGTLLAGGRAKRGHVALRLWQARQGAAGITAEEGKGPGVSTLTRHWSGCSRGTATSPGSWQSPQGAETCLQTPGAGRQLTCRLCPAGWSQGGRRLKLLPDARPSPCHLLISWTSLWDERQGMTPGFDPTSKVRGGRGAPKPGSDPCLWLPKTREQAAMGLGEGP